MWRVWQICVLLFCLCFIGCVFLLLLVWFYWGILRFIREQRQWAASSDHNSRPSWHRQFLACSWPQWSCLQARVRLTVLTLMLYTLTCSDSLHILSGYPFQSFSLLQSSVSLASSFLLLFSPLTITIAFVRFVKLDCFQRFFFFHVSCSQDIGFCNEPLISSIQPSQNTYQARHGVYVGARFERPYAAFSLASIAFEQKKGSVLFWWQWLWW